MRQAAAKGHPLFHGGELETGSPNVLAHNQPVWRAEEDEHGCAGGAPPPGVGTEPYGESGSIGAHGPEKLVEGAERVLVNGRRLGRQGDFLLGGGDPNMIAMRDYGFRVLVGENGVGSDSDAFQEIYCKEFCALKADWNELGENERIERWKDMTRRLFAALGMPEPTFSATTNPDHGGTFSGTTFNVEYNPGYFNGKWTIDDLSGMTWHEMRHGEQSFQGLRYALGRQQRGINPPGQKEYIEMADPRVIKAAKAAGPLDESTAEGRWAAMFADGDWTDAGNKQLGWAVADMSKYGNRYPTIPAGAEVRRNVDGGSNPRALRCKCGGK